MLNPPGFHSTSAIVAEIADTRDRKPGCDAMGEPVNLGDDIYKAEPEYGLRPQGQPGDRLPLSR